MKKTCIECDDYYCLDLKKGKCECNDYIYDENEKLYFSCLRTNKEGISCEECIEGYEVGKKGYCVDSSRCLEEEDGECLRCSEEENDNGYTYCANKIFGCIESITDNCKRCDNLLDLYQCTECKEGYILLLTGECQEA